MNDGCQVLGFYIKIRIGGRSCSITDPDSFEIDANGDFSGSILVGLETYGTISGHFSSATHATGIYRFGFACNMMQLPAEEGTWQVDLE